VECHPIKKINSEIKEAFGKARAVMTLKELKSTVAFILDAYPLQGESLVSFVSQPRGKRKRVRTKAEEIKLPQQETLWPWY
jgi:hypothetical protein